MASVVHWVLAAAVGWFALAPSAHAWSADELRRLQAGEIVMSSQPRAHGGIVDASVIVDAPQRLIYTLLADPRRAPEYSPGIVSAQILDDKGPVKRVRLHLQSMGLINEVQEVESTFTPYESIAWHQVKGRFASQYGQYRLTPVGGRTVLTYHIEIDTGMVLPSFVIEMFLRSSVPQLLRNIRSKVRG